MLFWTPNHEGGDLLFHAPQEPDIYKHSLNWKHIMFATSFHEVMMKVQLLGAEKSQSCLTLCNPMDRSLPGSSIHGIFQARKSTGVGCHFLLSDPGVEPGSPALQADALLSEPPGKPH